MLANPKEESHDHFLSELFFFNSFVGFWIEQFGKYRLILVQSNQQLIADNAINCSKLASIYENVVIYSENVILTVQLRSDESKWPKRILF